MQVPEWNQGHGDVRSVTEVVPPNLDGIPAVVHIHSKYSNIDGGYYLREDTFENYPVYYNKDGGMYLFHTSVEGTWKLSETLAVHPKGIYAKWKTDAVNILDLTPELCDESDVVGKIEHVTWADSTEDDEGKYVDLDFPAEGSSLGQEWLDKKPQYKGNAVEWIRVPDLNRHGDQELFGPVNPNDIEQGKVGNCWLVAAIACVAEFSGTIHGLFEQQSISEKGKYDISLYDVAAERWTIITIDDQVPCEKRPFWRRDAKPLFSHVSDREEVQYLWPIILEKAFAKFCQNYGALEAGMVSWAWQAMTGHAKQDWYRKTANERWDKLELAVDEQRKNIRQGERRACPFYQTQASFDHNQFWKIVYEADKSNYLMGASIDGGKKQREYERPDGLIEGHAYSVIRVEEIHAYGDVFQLLKLRNPWGNKEWNGAWSDGADEWDEYPDVAAELDPENLADGCFWIDFESFCNAYTSIYMCPFTTKAINSVIMSSKGDGQALRYDKDKAANPQAISRKGDGQALRTDEDDAIRYFKNTSADGSSMTIRLHPNIDARPRPDGQCVQPGEIFEVDKVTGNRPPQKYLRLADGRGYLFTHARNGQEIAVEVPPPPLPPTRTLSSLGGWDPLPSSAGYEIGQPQPPAPAPAPTAPQQPTQQPHPYPPGEAQPWHGPQPSLPQLPGRAPLSGRPTSDDRNRRPPLRPRAPPGRAQLLAGNTRKKNQLSSVCDTARNGCPIS